MMERSITGRGLSGLQLAQLRRAAVRKMRNIWTKTRPSLSPEEIGGNRDW